MKTERNYNQQGLLKLMLKMPALRGRLQIVSMRKPEMLNLCGAFEEASLTLERLIRENDPLNRQQIEEYQNICHEIEEEIIAICYQE
ncbi:MAG TPA: hypothetical protein VHC00_21100 [Rhizobiaceae bacterium]|nr:hypothetical protein [Rhizobiaceae bacterium]